MRRWILALLCLTPIAAGAGEADVLEVSVTPTGERTYRFDVTVWHADTGWDHYADAWEVLAPDGTMLGARRLLHPHTEEQPFTRSLIGVRIPEGVTEVTVRGHDSVHGHGGRKAVVELPRE
jgi:hypothetical protein